MRDLPSSGFRESSLIGFKNRRRIQAIQRHDGDRIGNESKFVEVGLEQKEGLKTEGGRGRGREREREGGVQVWSNERQAKRRTCNKRVEVIDQARTKVIIKKERALKKKIITQRKEEEKRRRRNAMCRSRGGFHRDEAPFRPVTVRH